MTTPSTARVVDPFRRDAWTVAFLGLVVRVAVVLWAWSRFPPAEDGHFYHVLAARIASGLGYTWAWPDGAVTFAAHYPVGYPALIALGYRLFGVHPLVAMLEQAVLGALAVRAVHGIAATTGSRRAALAAALVAALHPGLVFYTPAIMTEGVAASLSILAAWLAVRARGASSPARAVLAAGLVSAVATLVRPQSLVFAPFLGILAGTSPRSRVKWAAWLTAVTLLVCAPWTARNCVRMHSCNLVSANAGWNLFIGAKGTTGTFAPIDGLGVPPECRTVWGEAEKDACFGAAGRRAIAEHPLSFVAKIPRKLAVTFDYAGAAGWYLHAANPEAFGDEGKLVLGAAETLIERLALLSGIAALALGSGPRRPARRALGGLSAAFTVLRAAWVAHVGLGLLALLLGRRLLDRPAAFVAAMTVLGTAAVHAVFFGAGRYSLVCFPALSALAGVVLTLGRGAGDTE